MIGDKLIEFQYNNETYKIYKGKIVDELFCELCDSLRSDVAVAFVRDDIDIFNLNEDKIDDYIFFLKENGASNSVPVLIRDIMEKFPLSTGYKRKIAPIYTSALRSIGHSQKAIDFFENNELNISVALLTSVAAAYIDVKDFEKARKTINRAFAKAKASYANAEEMGNISKVYERLNKEEV